MVTSIRRFVGCLVVVAVLAGCGDSAGTKDASTSSGDSSSGLNAAPGGTSSPASQAPPQNLSGLGPPGMGPPGMGQPGGAPAGTPGGAPAGSAPATAGGGTGGGIPNIQYMPESIALAIGGRPASLFNCPNEYTANFLDEFRPLLNLLEKVGLGLNHVESFWAGANQGGTAHLICLSIGGQVNPKSVRDTLGLTPGSKVGSYEIFNFPKVEQEKGLVFVDQRTVLAGSLKLLEEALNRPQPGPVREALGAMNFPQADVWIGGNEAATRAHFASGLPLIGAVPSVRNVKGFSIGYELEEKANAPQNQGGGFGTPGGPGGPGVSAPPAGLGGPPGTPDGMGPGGSSPQNQEPPKIRGIGVVLGLALDIESSAVGVGHQLELFFKKRAEELKPKTWTITFTGPGAGGGSGDGGMGPGGMGPGGMGPGGPPAGGPPGSAPPGGGPGPGGSAPPAGAGGPSTPGGPPGAPGGGNTITIREPDNGLRPIDPSRKASEAAASGATTPGGFPGAPSSGPPGGMGPLGGPPGMGPFGAPPGAPPGTGQQSSSTGGSEYATAKEWVRRKNASLQIAYRYDVVEEEFMEGVKVATGLMSFVSDLLLATGSYPIGNGIFDGSLVEIYRGTESLRTEKGSIKGVTRVNMKHDQVVLCYSWMTHLLPYVGHNDTYVQFNFDKTWGTADNYRLATRVVTQFLNPADRRTRAEGFQTPAMALTHFVGMAGYEDLRTLNAGTLPRTDPRAGVFGYDAVATPEQITDGLSNTMMVVGAGRLVGGWVQGGGATVRGAREPFFNPISGFGSRGLNPPGVFVLMADGSVRIIGANVDPAVFRALSTIHGNEQVTLPPDTSAPPTLAPSAAGPAAAASGTPTAGSNVRVLDLQP